MSRLVNMVGVASVGRALWDLVLLRRIVPEAAAILVLAVIASMMAGTLLLGGCYALMQMFIRRGIESDLALLATGGVVAVIGITAAALAVVRLKRLQKSLYPLPPAVSDVTDAFMDGLRGR